MEKNFLRISAVVFILFHVSVFTVFADVAPDPIVQTISYLPLILIIAVVAIAVLMLIKFFKK